MEHINKDLFTDAEILNEKEKRGYQ